MSLMIECPYCNLQLPVPVDNPSERIICGGCWGVFDASAFEKPAHAVRAKPVSIRPNRYDDDEREDREDWEDDHPRRRRANRYRDDEDDDWDYRQRRHAPAPGESAAIASLVLGIFAGATGQISSTVEVLAEALGLADDEPELALAVDPVTSGEEAL